LASKINEAKDILSSYVEKEESNSDLNKENDSDEETEIEPFGKYKSERFLLSILCGHKQHYNAEERKELLKIYSALCDQEKEDYKKQQNNQYEYVKKKEEDLWEQATFVDKNSEFYEKYKDKIENEDYLDIFDDINGDRKRIKNKEFIKI